MNTNTKQFSLRSEVELCTLNTYGAWQEEKGRLYSPFVSRFTRAELHSGLPFHTENEPVRFSRHGKIRSQKWAEMYALRWMTRYNRRLMNRLFDVSY